MRNSRSRPYACTGAERRGRAQRTALAFCAIVAFAAARPVAAQLVVDPLEVLIITGGSQRAVGSFSIVNPTDSAVQATITRQDWDRAENGDNRFLAAGTTGRSCGPRLSASPLVIRVEAHTSRIVRLGADSLRLTQECWDIFFVEAAPQRASVKGNSLQYIFRTGVKVYAAPPGLTRDGAVEDLAIEDTPLPRATVAPVSSAALPGAKRQVAIRFHNTGGMHLLAKGRLEFRRLDNTLAMQVPIGEFPTLPGAVRKMLVDVPAGITPGDYVILALIDFGGSELVAGQIDYQAK